MLAKSTSTLRLLTKSIRQVSAFPIGKNVIFAVIYASFQGAARFKARINGAPRRISAWKHGSYAYSEHKGACTASQGHVILLLRTWENPLDERENRQQDQEASVGEGADAGSTGRKVRVE